MARVGKYLTEFLAVVMVVTIVLLSLGNEMVFAEVSTITPAIEYIIYQPSPNVTYTNTMMIGFSYDVSYKDSGAKSLGLSNYYSIDNGANQSFPTAWYVKDADISKLSNGTHELTVYIDAPFVYNDVIFSNTFKLFSTNFTVLNLPPTPSPTIPEATSSLTPSIPRNPPHLDPTVYLIPISVIVAVVIVSLLLFRTHRKTANSTK
jgi:hypothetical protein